MLASMGMTAATTLGGVVTGMMVGDAMGAIPTKVAVPATSNNATPKATANGKPVSSNMSPRQSLWLSAFFVVGAIAVLVFGDRFLKDARIG
jgi:hypothetical protein